MAFNLFKKKEELKYPEEKASVLDKPFEEEEKPESFGPPPSEFGRLNAKGPVGPMQPSRVDEFKKGFMSPSDMAAPPMPPPELRSPVAPKPLPPAPEPRGDLFQPRPAPRTAATPPHIFIRINKYKEVMNTVRDLHRGIREAKEDLENLDRTNMEESEKLKDAAGVILRIEDLLQYLENTFTSPEE